MTAVEDLRKVFGEMASWWGSNTNRQAILPQYSGPQGPNFPYHTKAAEKAWIEAQQVMRERKDLMPAQVIDLALKVAGLQTTDLTPEDLRLLEIGVEWRMYGTKDIKRPRIGGMPGGPFRSDGEGHALGVRGAP